MKNILKITTGLLLLLYLSSCVKEDFDIVPEKKYFVDFEANSTISELKNIYQGSDILIDTNIIIKGVVSASDETGNFYKEIYIQDSTGALNIRLNASDLFKSLPVGQLVYIKCEGLYLGTYQEVFQLGYGPNVDRIEEYMIKEFLFKSDGGVPVEPELLTIDQFNDDDLGILIKLENVEFTVQDTSKTYADAINLEDENRDLKDCNGNIVIVRTSGYASFAGDSIPKGNGTLTAILNKFEDDYQLKIRTVDEVDLKGVRCSK